MNTKPDDFTARRSPREFAKESMERSYFDSLREHRQGLKSYSVEELEHLKEKEVVDVQYHTEKPKKFLSQEQKNMIHKEVDLKMQELEDTGLTRFEILYNDERGIPLADDPVFQYLKINIIAREMLIKDDEPFTVENIIDKALRQDLEPDPSISKKGYFRHSKRDDFDEKRHYKQMLGNKHHLMNEESYIYGYDTYEKALNLGPGKHVEHEPVKDWRLKRKLDQLEWESEKPPAFMNKPLRREDARKKFMRKANSKDFNWKDTAVITQFLTDAGKIKNRYQTRLSDQVQNALARTVKTSRHMGLIPYVGMIKPTNKISLRSFQEDLEDFNKKSIDPITGKLFYSSAQSDLSQRYAKPKGLGRETAKYKNKDLKIDNMPIVLNENQMQWLEAQGYSVKKKEKEGRKIQVGVAKDTTQSEKDEPDYVGGEVVYDGIRETLDKSLTLDDLPDFFINEKAHLNVAKNKR